MSAVVSFCMPAFAQGPPAPTGPAELHKLTLEQAVAFAHEHQPQILAALQRVHVEQAQSSAVMARWYPSLVGTAQLMGSTVNQTSATFFGVAGVEFNRIAGTPSVRYGETQPYPSTFAGLGLRQEAFDFGKYEAEAAVHDALAQSEEANTKLVALNTRYQVETAYFGVLAAKSIQRAAEDAYVRAKTHRDYAAAGVKSGMRPPIELTRAEAELARIDFGRLRAAGGLSAARLGLATVMGAPDMPVDTVDTPMPSAAAPPLVLGLQMAEEHHPELQRVVLQLRSEERNGRAIRFQYAPDLYVQGILYGYAGGIPPGKDPIPIGNGWLPSVPNYALALVLRVPIVDIGVLKRAEVSDAQQEALRAETALTAQRVDAAVRSAYIERDLAQGVLPALERGASAARDNWAQADARFRAGLGTAVELADAESIRQDAEIQLAIGQFNLARARAAVARAIAEGVQ